MKRIRSYLRASMGQDRFTGLSQLNIHREVMIPLEKIISEFAKKSKRRADFAV